MKGLWAIAVDELRSKRALLMGMLALGALPWAAPFFPGLHRFDAADVRSASMILVGLSLPPALGLGLGASAVGEEIGGRRLGFYFARPIGAWAIWGGDAGGPARAPARRPRGLHSGGDRSSPGEARAGRGTRGRCGPLRFALRPGPRGSRPLPNAVAVARPGSRGRRLRGRRFLPRGAAHGRQRGGRGSVPRRSLARRGTAGLLPGRGPGPGGLRADRSPARTHGPRRRAVGGLLLCLGMSSAAAAWYLSPPPADLQDRVVLPPGGRRSLSPVRVRFTRPRPPRARVRFRFPERGCPAGRRPTVTGRGVCERAARGLHRGPALAATGARQRRGRATSP